MRADGDRSEHGANKTRMSTSTSSGEGMLEAPDDRLATPDEFVVRAPPAGDAAREELFHRHRDDSYRVAYRLGHERDALDVVQEAMLKAFSALGDFDGPTTWTWLLKIVTEYGVRLETTWQTGVRILMGVVKRTAASRQATTIPAIAPARPPPGPRPALDRLTSTIRTTTHLFAELGMSPRKLPRSKMSRSAR